MSGAPAAFTSGYKQFANRLGGESPQVIMASNSPASGNAADVGYKLNASASQAAGSYSNVIGVRRNRKLLRGVGAMRRMRRGAAIVCFTSSRCWFPEATQPALLSIHRCESRATQRENQVPHVSGDRIVWCGSGGEGSTTTDTEIWTWSPGDAQPTQVTNNAEPDYGPDISGNRIVWAGRGGAGTATDNEIWTWRPGDAAPMQVTDNAVADEAPRVSGDRIVWGGTGGAGTTTTDTKSGPGGPATHRQRRSQTTRCWIEPAGVGRSDSLVWKWGSWTDNHGR